MARYSFKTSSRKLLADIITPVSIYLRIRDVYPNSLLLESSDYHGNENSYSFICMKPVAGFEVIMILSPRHILMVENLLLKLMILLFSTDNSLLLWIHLFNLGALKIFL